MTVRESDGRGGMVRALGRGVAWGLAWGVAARGFMRLFADQPEFSWTGTGFIVGLSVLLFTGLSLVRAAREAGRSRWWRLAPLPGLLLFAGPGIPLAAALLGGLVAGRWRRSAVRWSVAGLGAAATVALLLVLVLTDPTASPVTTADVVGLMVYAGCALAVALAAAEWTRRRDHVRRPAQEPAAVLATT